MSHSSLNPPATEKHLTEALANALSSVAVADSNAAINNEPSDSTDAVPLIAPREQERQNTSARELPSPTLVADEDVDHSLELQINQLEDDLDNEENVEESVDAIRSFIETPEDKPDQSEPRNVSPMEVVDQSDHNLMSQAGAQEFSADHNNPLDDPMDPSDVDSELGLYSPPDLSQFRDTEPTNQPPVSTIDHLQFVYLLTNHILFLTYQSNFFLIDYTHSSNLRLCFEINTHLYIS